MAIVSISEASRRWRVGRSNLYRAVKSGRLNLSARPDGSRGIDTSELVRVFGEPSARTPADLSADTDSPPDPDDREQERILSPVVLLQAQVNQLFAQLEQAHEREARLLAMLENEQQARRDLEQKLLPPPPPPPPPEPPPRRHHRLWLLLAILALAVAALVWTRTSAYWPLGE